MSGATASHDGDDPFVKVKVFVAWVASFAGVVIVGGLLWHLATGWQPHWQPQAGTTDRRYDPPPPSGGGQQRAPAAREREVPRDQMPQGVPPNASANNPHVVRQGRMTTEYYWKNADCEGRRFNPHSGVPQCPE